MAGSALAGSIVSGFFRLIKCDMSLGFGFAASLLEEATADDELLPPTAVDDGPSTSIAANGLSPINLDSSFFTSSIDC